MAKASPESAIRRILAVDIGGTGLKVAIVGPDGKFLSEKLRVKTPHHPTPAHVIAALVELVVPLGAFDHVSIGFPGPVRGGVVLRAPNLGDKAWANFALVAALEKKWKRPVLLHNDADIQGLGAIHGKGLELVCTLGTGFGTAWFRDGELMPHMDLSHFAMHTRDDFDNYIGDHTRKKIGHKAWNKRIAKLIAMLAQVFYYDRLYFGGGNAQRIDVKLPGNVSIVSNDLGMEGSAFAWHQRRFKASAPKAPAGRPKAPR